MKLRFLFVRAAAGTLAVGNAAPVNLPFAVQAQVAEAASADAPAHAAVRLVPIGQRDNVDLADADRDLRRNGDLHQDVRLKIGPHGELPCDSGDWANSSLFGPRAAVLAALGATPADSSEAAAEAALADALGDTPTGDANSSAFGSVFGNAPHANGLGDFLGGGSGGGTTGGGTTGGGGTTDGGGGTTGGTGTGTNTGGGGTGTGTGPIGGGGTSDPVTGGGTTSPGTGGGTTGGGTTPPIGPIQPINPGGGAGHGGGGGDNSTGQPNPPVTGAVPEPASWLTMLFGFGLIGGMLRRRRPVAA